MDLLDFAKRELDLINMREDSNEMDASMRGDILEMVQLFSDQGHSGASAAYSVAVLQKLLKYEPLSPLTGDNDEWVEVYRTIDDEPIYQNTRCSRVFKDATGTYDIEGIVFWKWEKVGEDYIKNYFTNIESRVKVYFPYSPKTEYVEKKDE